MLDLLAGRLSRSGPALIPEEASMTISLVTYELKGIPPARRIVGARRESDDCPAVRHRHSHKGFIGDHCRCPSTVDAHVRYVALERIRRSGGSPVPVDRGSAGCKSTRHRHTPDGYRVDGCRCPETVTVFERDLQRRRANAERVKRGDPQRYVRPQIDLNRADWVEARALADGHRFSVRVDKHTRALAVSMMQRANPGISAAEIAARLTDAGQGIQVWHDDQGLVRYPVSQRYVVRVRGALADWHRSQKVA